MVKEAEEHASSDKLKRELVETKNQADGLIHTTEKNLSEHGDKLPDDQKAAIESDIAALREAITGEDIGPIKQKLEALAQSAMKLGEAMYKAEQAGDDAAAAAADETSDAQSPGDGDDDSTVVDADFEEVDDDKKDQSSAP